MSEQSKSSRSLSEISHLFLSSVRERQAPATARPKRTPPKTDIHSELTPEEIAHVNGECDPLANREAHGGAPRVIGLIASHLGASQPARAREYAAHLAADGQRVGLLEIDSNQIRVGCFDVNGSIDGSRQAVETVESRHVEQMLTELSSDLDVWIVLPANPRTPEARAVLDRIGHWTVLCSCTNNGVVACYRNLKG
ncbi:MAG: hypothetical protein ACREJC_10355, partial [Tepidisphaeraceae bacterium]